jgi:hypothetical protein
LRDYARGGSAVEAVWITAQGLGLSVQPVSPVFLYAQSRAELDELSPDFADELDQLQQEFGDLTHASSDESVALVLRLTSAPPASVRSRRAVDRVRLLSD